MGKASRVEAGTVAILRLAAATVMFVAALCMSVNDFGIREAKAAATWTTVSSSMSPLALEIDDSDNLWIGDADGADQDGVRVVPSADTTIFGVPVIGGVDTLLFELPSVQGILMDSSGRLFIATGAGNLYVVTPIDSNVFNVSTEANELTLLDAGGPFFGGLAMDSAGNLFGGRLFNGGIAVLPVATGELFGVSLTANDPSMLSASPPWSGDVAIDSYDNLLIGSWFDEEQGLWVLPKTTGSLYGQPVMADTLEQLVSISNVAGLDVDGSNNVFFAIWGGGNIYVLSEDGGELFGESFLPDVTAQLTSSIGNADQGVAVSTSGNLLLSGGSETKKLVWTDSGAEIERASHPRRLTVTLDPSGGTCKHQESPWTVSQRGSVTLPSARDCTRDGYTFLGWTRDPAKTTPESLLHTFVARSGTVTAVWGKLPNPPFAVFALRDFLCNQCGNALVIWQTTDTDTTGFTVTVDNTPSTCTLITLGNWSLCGVSGLTPNQPHTFGVSIQNTNGTSSTTRTTQ